MCGWSALRTTLMSNQSMQTSVGLPLIWFKYDLGFNCYQCFPFNWHLRPSLNAWSCEPSGHPIVTQLEPNWRSIVLKPSEDLIMAKMSEEMVQELKDLKNILNSIIVPNPNGLSLRHLCNDFQEIEGLKSVTSDPNNQCICFQAKWFRSGSSGSRVWPDCSSRCPIRSEWRATSQRSIRWPSIRSGLMTTDT